MRNPDKEIYKRAISIVNQLFDLAEVPIDKRQSVNDIATRYVKERLEAEHNY